MNIKIFSLIFFYTSLLIASNSSQFSYYNIGGFEDSFKKELSSVEEAESIIKRSKNNSSFIRAYKLLNENLKPVDSFKSYNTKNYIKILDFLKAANIEYADWIGLTLFMQVEHSIEVKNKYKIYGLYFAKKLIKYNLCNGYLAEGIYFKRSHQSFEKQLNAYKSGINNKCRGTKYEKFCLFSRKNVTLYDLKEKE